jgi:hypothetical protein
MPVPSALPSSPCMAVMSARPEIVSTGASSGLGPVQFGELLGPPVLELVGHGPVDQGRGLLGNEAEE